MVQKFQQKWGPSLTPFEVELQAVSFVLALLHREIGGPTIERTSRRLNREIIPIVKRVNLYILFHPLTDRIHKAECTRLYSHRKKFSEGAPVFCANKGRYGVCDV